MLKLLKGLAVFLVATFLMGLLPNSVSADGCFTNRSYYGVQQSYAPVTYSYQQKVYAVPYAGYSYVPTYSYTPKVVEAIVAPDYYYAGRGSGDKALLEALRLLEGQINRNQQQPGPVVPPTFSPQGPGPEGSVVPGRIQQAPQTPMVPLNQQPQIEVIPHNQGAANYQEPKLLAVVQQSCARCHSEGKAEAGLVLVRNGQLAPLTGEQWNECFVRVFINEPDKPMMPLGGKPLADAEMGLFRGAANYVKAVEKLAKR